MITIMMIVKYLTVCLMLQYVKYKVRILPTRPRKDQNIWRVILCTDTQQNMENVSAVIAAIS